MQDFRVGFGYDSHRLASGLPLILGGVQIPSAYGCIAHSDGDAVIHALCDALFGAAGMADIGTHFPDNQAEYKGVDSTILLKKTLLLLQEAGWKVHNVDLTIVLEKPKLVDYKALMQKTLSSILGLSLERVAVKAKSNEKMGLVGKGEGVVVWAVATIIRENES